MQAAICVEYEFEDALSSIGEELTWPSELYEEAVGLSVALARDEPATAVDIAFAADILQESAWDSFEDTNSNLHAQVLHGQRQSAACKKQCGMLDTFGTAETWVGKNSYSVSLNAQSKFMLHIMQWPMVSIFQACGAKQLYLCAMTCVSLRQLALQIIETRAHKEITRKFFSSTQLFKFVDVFACFESALRLKQWMPYNSFLQWTETELDAIFASFTHISAPEVVHFYRLQTTVACAWKMQGRCAFGNFVRDCVSDAPSYRKILFHYNKTWFSIKKLFMRNADIIMDGKFGRGVTVVRDFHVSWPTVTVNVSADVWDWTPKNVYEFFRLKKFPVAGLNDLQLNGAELLRLFTLGESCCKGKNIFTTARPQGMGMTSQQYIRFASLMRARSNFNQEEDESKTFTFLALP